MNMASRHMGKSDEEKFGLRIALRLSEAAEVLPHDISERLRAARVRAVSARGMALTKPAPYASVSNGTLLLGNERLGGWGRLAATAPLVALVLGLVFISVLKDDEQANELAEIDSALLIDDLPPSAYADPGFAQFLKLKSENNQ